MDRFLSRELVAFLSLRFLIVAPFAEWLPALGPKVRTKSRTQVIYIIGI